MRSAVRLAKRTAVSASAAVLVATSLVPVHAAAVDMAGHRTVDGRIDDWRGTTSRFGGTWQYSSGELVYQDHLFDDLGADTGQRSQQHSTLGWPKGDFRYPTDEARYGNNAADLLELRLAADAESLWVLARMNTLKVPDGTVVAIAIDADDDPATGGGSWPYSAGVSANGADAVITLWGTGGTVTHLPSGASVPISDVAADPGNDNNAIEARVPRSVLAGGSSVVRVWAATGLWNSSASEWMAVPLGSPTSAQPGGGSPLIAARPFNVGFRSGESGQYMENRQADALNAGDLTAFGAQVDIEDLADGVDRPYKVQPGTFYSVIIDEKVSIPPQHEGMSYSGVPGRFAGIGGVALAQTFDFYGRHQPYGLYIPSAFDGVTPLPAAFVLHGLGGSHSSYNSQPGFIRDMGEGDGSTDQPPMFLITPLARGSSFYADWGEADTLAVLDDVFARFPIDEERVYITGYSMGGYGVYRLASLYPDRFAAAGVWAGYTGEFLGVYLTDPQSLVGDPTGLGDAFSGIVQPIFSQFGIGGGRMGKASIGNPVDTLENLRHLPTAHFAGTNDEIVPTTGQLAAPLRLAELGYRSRLELYPGYEHFSFAIVDDWKEMRAWLGNRTRQTNPREIVYKFSDGWTAPGLAEGLRIEHGDAWWLHGLTMRESTLDGLTLASIRAVSRAMPARAAVVRREMAITGTPTPHLDQLVSWDEGDPLPQENRLDLELQGVGTADVDMPAAGLDPCGLALGLTSDGAASIRLVGKFATDAQIVGLDGVASHVERDTGALVVDIKGPVKGKASVLCPAMFNVLGLLRAF